MSVCHVCRSPKGSQGIEFPGTRVRGSCEAPKGSSGNQTSVLWESRVLSAAKPSAAQLLSHLSKLTFSFSYFFHTLQFMTVNLEERKIFF